MRAPAVNRAAAFLVAAPLAMILAAAAWGYWSVPASHGTGAASTATLGPGSAPTAVAHGTSVVVTWGSSGADSGRPADGYYVKRYDAGTGVVQTVLAGCAGLIAGSTCTETSTPSGDWTYTVTPAVGVNWRGAESLRSGVAQAGPTTVQLVTSLFGAPLPATTAGTVTGFGPLEHLTYTLDGTPIAGSADADATGNAAISVTIPAGTADGTHTVRVVGHAQTLPSNAEVAIVVDTAPPVISSFLTPAANAAGWNRTSPVEVNGTVDDGTGSGIAFVKSTTDLSDPRTSPTAQYALAPLVATATTTYKYYGVDLAGNASVVQTIQVNIDTIAPHPTSLNATNVVGGAWVNH
ncbi:MAG: hypothetical protein ACR2KV_09155 [Solirubrobacteraceae bacterium]